MNGRKLGLLPTKAKVLMQALWLPHFMQDMPAPPPTCDFVKGFSEWGMAPLWYPLG